MDKLFEDAKRQLLEIEDFIISEFMKLSDDDRMVMIMQLPDSPLYRRALETWKMEQSAESEADDVSP